MAMEAETLVLIYLGFYLVMGFSLLITIKLWLTSKNNSFIWFIIQLIFLFLSFSKFIHAIKMKPEISQTMMSEENSLALAKSGILWAVSMFCMLKGVWNLNRKDGKLL